MTNSQWWEEVRRAFNNTDWVDTWSGVSRTGPQCFADVRNRRTKRLKTIDISLEVFSTPEARKAEILRQLAI